MSTNADPDHERVVSLYDQHARELYRFVHRLCLDHAIAEDVTQDVFLAALSQPSTALSAGWLMRSARNRLIDIVRRQASYDKKVRLLRRTIDDAGDDPVAVVEHLGLRTALGRLRTEHRIVLMLHYVEGASVSDLAEELGRSYKGAEGLLSRARTALRTELENER